MFPTKHPKTTYLELQEEILSVMSMEREVASISVLSEGCIAKIMSLTSPRDVCALSLVSHTFKSAGDWDMIWETFLPSDYREMILKSPSSLSLSDFPTKKELYFHLCTHPLLLEGGKMSLTLEKLTGKKKLMIGAKDLAITWGNSPEYWQWTSQSDSRFSEVAQLLAVCWLEIHGKIQTRILSPKTTYEVYLVIKFSDNIYGLDYPGAQVSVEFASGVGTTSGNRTVYLDHECNLRSHARHVPNRLGLIRRRFGHILRPMLSSLSEYESQFPKNRGDGWMEVEMGNFYNDEGKDGEVVMTLKEIKSGEWKGGLIVEGIELRPKEI